MLEFTISPEHAGQRLDVCLATLMPDWSRSQIQRLISSGMVTVDSKLASKSGQSVCAGSRVAVRAEREELRAYPEALPLAVVYENDDFLVVNKAAGMAVHIGAGLRCQTLVNAVLHYLGEPDKLSSIGGALRPGIVHRLDRLTSGLVVVAKNDFAHRRLAAQFKSRKVQKTYVLLVHGRIARDFGEIAQPVGRDPVRRTRMKVGGIRPREALTSFRVLRRFPKFTLVEARPHTGRTHQLRVHFSSIGHPLVGDTRYGAPARFRISPSQECALDRIFLHAAALEFEHPRTGKPIDFHAPLPPELEELLRRILNQA